MGLNNVIYIWHTDRVTAIQTVAIARAGTQIGAANSTAATDYIVLLVTATIG